MSEKQVKKTFTEAERPYAAGVVDVVYRWVIWYGRDTLHMDVC